MRAAGIVAEYNPFHNGHAYHIACTREAGATHVAAVMSGYFTQRGEPAVMPIAARCEAAILGGADLILELPLPWACASAETFAYGAVSILHALGCIDMLSFGSECGDIHRISQTTNAVTRLDGSSALADALATGVSFPRARELALMEQLTKDELAMLQNPNDTLAVEYLKALEKLHATMTPIAVRRAFVAHDMGGAANGYASASSIREMLTGGRLDEACELVPENLAQIYRRTFEEGHAPFLSGFWEPIMLAQLRRMSESDFARLPDVGEGLENRICKAVRQSTSMDNLLGKIKTKRYTLSRIRRILISACLGLTRADTQCPPPYIRVLGLNCRGAALLKLAKKSASLPIITRRSDMDGLGEQAQRVYALECLAADLYGLCLPSRLPCGQTQTYTPFMAQD